MSTKSKSGLLAATFLAAFAMTAARASDELPRYRLKPGTELTYKGSSTYESHVDEEETTAWIARRNDDGSVRVVVREGIRFIPIPRGGSVDDLFKDKPKPPMEFTVGYFDLFADGRIGPDAEFAHRIVPAYRFPRLPDDAEQAKAGWTQRDETILHEFHYSSFQTEPDGWAFHSERVGWSNKIYGWNFEHTFHFDAALGAIRQVEGEFPVKLVRVTAHDASWLSAFAPASDHYFAALKSYDQTIKEATRATNDVEAKLTEAKETLQSTRDATDHPIFRALLDDKLAKHDGMIQYWTDSAKQRAEVLGKPAADWELKGLDGKTHKLADYRGKVVVLDFWYRGCGWCIKAMPQINALTEQFHNRPVAVLGMNTDEDEADAKLVSDTMGLKYTTLLHADDLPEKYGVRGFPTLILIDPEGTVRETHVGYSKTLQTDIAKVIERLLPPN